MATKKAERAAPAKLPPLWDRLKAQMTGTTGKLRQNQRAYKALKIAIMVLAVAMPIVAEWGALAVGIAAGFILLLVGLQHFNNGKKTGFSTARSAIPPRSNSISTTRKAGPYAKLTPEEALGCSPSASRVDDVEHS